MTRTRRRSWCRGGGGGMSVQDDRRRYVQICFLAAFQRKLHNLALSKFWIFQAITYQDHYHDPSTLDDPSIYIGNPYLCGPPSTRNCSANEINYEDNESPKDKSINSEK
ncbi:hypothetical protein ACMD2_20509 [Ananas comosus]|uniref:Uncharacterized protein n=1 Tax=Ananas comosus TaxID=4615 RepID=A0A199UEC8_ANACO|nr:hypothetical protein ACMD2_20509 [Ananas comosus]